ncbi:MAG: iron-sulfur cluster assembly accessory protein [Cyanobacteriota bacterium]|nr:iron-sulfur cluster assembly accessory protein [Cyanobacteriota bacterium]
MTAPSMTPTAAAQPLDTGAAAPAAPASSEAATHIGIDGRGIRITEPAMRQLAMLMGQQGEGKVLRVGVRSGGCSGMSYTMDFIDTSAIREDDEHYTYQPAQGDSFDVVCDPKSLLYIYGLQLDFSTALIGGGFNFTNPNATQTCGCGSSFAV